MYIFSIRRKKKNKKKNNFQREYFLEKKNFFVSNSIYINKITMITLRRLI